MHYPKGCRFRIWVRPSILIGIAVAVGSVIVVSWIEFALEDRGSKLCRILLYIIQTHTGDKRISALDYAQSHGVMTAAWRRLNADTEFCEQTELDLPLDGWIEL